MKYRLLFNSDMSADHHLFTDGGQYWLKMRFGNGGDVVTRCVYLKTRDARKARRRRDHILQSLEGKEVEL